MARQQKIFFFCSSTNSNCVQKINVLVGCSSVFFFLNKILISIWFQLLNVFQTFYGFMIFRISYQRGEKSIPFKTKVEANIGLQSACKYTYKYVDRVNFHIQENIQIFNLKNFFYQILAFKHLGCTNKNIRLDSLNFKFKHVILPY